MTNVLTREPYARSFWADLHTSYALFAEEATKRDIAGTSTCVLGCSDGKYVIPLTAAGSRVTAVDVDPVMLDGGEVVYLGETISIRGLRRNLRDENLEDRCSVVEADFMEWQTDQAFDFVLTSGSWPYHRNLRHGLGGVVSRMQRLVAPDGLLFADYLLPHTNEEKAIDLYTTPSVLSAFFRPAEWTLLHNQDIGLIRERHYPGGDWHEHHYGALVAARSS